MKLLDTFKSKYAKKQAPVLRSGDVVRIHEKIKEGKKERIQIFEGIVIANKNGKGLDGTFTVRKISLGIGVEKTFPLHSPKIIKIEISKKIRSKKSKLYYLRDLTQKQIQRKSELAEYVSWEDTSAKEEEEELRKIKEEEAKKKEDAKKKEQADLDKKFAQSRGDENIKAEDKQDDKKDEKSGK